MVFNYGSPSTLRQMVRGEWNLGCCHRRVPVGIWEMFTERLWGVNRRDVSTQPLCISSVTAVILSPSFNGWKLTLPSLFHILENEHRKVSFVSQVTLEPRSVPPQVLIPLPQCYIMHPARCMATFYESPVASASGKLNSLYLPLFWRFVFVFVFSVWEVVVCSITSISLWI